MRNLRRNKPLDERGVGTNVDQVLAAREAAAADAAADKAEELAGDKKEPAATETKPAPAAAPASTVKPVAAPKK